MQSFAHRDPSRFGQFSTVDTTTIHPLGLAALIVVLAGIFLGRRQHVLVWAIALLCFIPSGQRIVIAGIDFAFLRILALALSIRVFTRHEARSMKITPLDWVVLVFAFWPLVAGIARGSAVPLIRPLGYGADLVLIYFSTRALIRGFEDVRVLARGLVLISIPVLIAFTIEKLTARNLFAIFGGVSPITAVREGKLRVQGAFAHPILAGVWWSAVIPLFLALVWSPIKSNDRYLGVLGIVISVILIILCASSTPLAGLGVALVGALVFPARRWLRPAWVGLLCIALAVHLVHDLGVHHAALAKFPGLTGSTGYHRYLLIDACMRHMNEWFMFGGDSSYHWGWGLDDVTCEYVRAALGGGIIQVAALIGIFVLSFKTAGSYIRTNPKSTSAVVYAIGLALAVHMICFIAVSYFGQILFLFWMSVGVLQSLCQSAARYPVPQPASRQTVRPESTAARRRRAGLGLS